MHIWLYDNNHNLAPKITEGFCNLGSYLIYENDKTSIDKNEDLLAIYGTALFDQNKYKSALDVFRKAYSIS